MSTPNDSDSLTTLSEPSSICGDSCDLRTENERLREKIMQLEAGKQVQVVPPSWISKENEAVEHSLDEFRVAFNGAKQCLLGKRAAEDSSEDYQEKKKAARLTEEMNEVWMSAARDVRQHLGGIIQKLNSCSNNKVAVKTETVEQQLWKDVDLSGIPADELPILEMSETVPVVSAEAINICRKLFGTWSYNDTRTCPDTASVPSKLVISLHSSGFFRYGCQTNSEPSSYYCFRPDGKEYNKMNGSKRLCTVNGDQILCRYGSATEDVLVESFRFLSENRIEFTTNNGGSTERGYIYVAARH